MLQEYIWFDGLPVAVVDGQTDEVYFVRTDHIGRPVFATDDTGAKVWEASYLPFGGVHVSTGPAIDLRFPGQWFHASSGLHQNWMRDYDPTTGRYIQADPLGLVDGASVYGYALQNPGRYVDPTGEFVPILVGALIGGAGNAAVQLGFRYYFGGGDARAALRCINYSSVINAAAFGAAGARPIGMIFGGIIGGNRRKLAQGVGQSAVISYVGLGLPNISIGDECECRLDSAPPWVHSLMSLF